MKPKHLFTSLLGVTALLVASCSTPKLAQNSAIDDDVYGTVAKAKEYKQADPVQPTQADNSAYTTSDPYYDMDYASRIDRFYYGSPYRNYYDPYYNYYGYNSWYGYGPYYGYSLGGYFNNIYYNWYNPYSYYGWGNPYYGSWWGPYSYYGGGYWGGGYWGGGYWGGGYYAGRGSYNNPNYGARPSRGSENGVGRASGRGNYYGGGVSSGIPSRANNGNGNGTTVTRSRAEMYNPATNGTTTRPSGTSSTYDRPTRGGSTTDSRPTRSEAPSRPQPTYNPPPQQSSPPPSSGGGGRSGGGSSGGGGGGGGRPTRGGR